jgi:dolichol-phosphate mannosyltransferase
MLHFSKGIFMNILNDQKPILVFVPTFNEVQNVEMISKRILDTHIELDILFLDDNSPDGTGELLDKMSLENNRIKVLHRKHKQGIGSAHIAGIRWGYENGYNTIITMDCDMTHDPSMIPNFLEKAKSADIVVGSRYIEKNSLPGWNLFRKIMTHGGHFLTKNILGIRQDATGGFRLYRSNRVPKEIFNLIVSKGYSFFYESLFLLIENGFHVQEIPLSLPARTYGSSKMSLKEITRSVFNLFLIGWKRLSRPSSFKINMNASIEINNELIDKQGWDEYWNKKNNLISKIYDMIAVFYRLFIIRPSLSYYLKKFFRNGDNILHAGCGSGQVDVDVRKFFSITALDISPQALSIYQNVNGSFSRTIHGSLFNIPFEKETFEGIYNLGVMEHFNEEDIVKILKQFWIVLKPGGKIVLFWPPSYGFSVIFLSFVHKILNKILNKNLKLHPNEISLIQSREMANTILHKSGFQLKEYKFGIRDLFTYAIIVGQKV